MRALLFILFLFSSGLSAQGIPETPVKNKWGVSTPFSSLVKEDTIYIVSFWATWCTPCIKELREISEIYSTLQDSFRLKLIAVSIDDSRNSSKVFPKAVGEGWTYEVVLDQNQDLARSMNVINVPMMFIINRKREIVYSRQGYSPGMLEEILTELDKIR
jgi:thiol-disulfide isomerase/thioredoxin